MDLPYTSPEQDWVDCTDETGSEISSQSALCSQDPPNVATNLPLASLLSIQPKDIPHVSNNMGVMSLREPRGTAISMDTSQPDQIIPPSENACLRCRDRKSRCSEGCSHEVFDCNSDGSRKSKPKRLTSCSPGSAKAAEISLKVTKAKGANVQVRNACTRCQHRKAKCSGTRPACAYCAERQLNCTYNVAEGTTRTNDLKRKLRDTSNKAHAFGLVLSVMREGNDHQATEVLARLRMGESLLEVLCSLPITSASSPTSEFKSELNRHLSMS